MNSQKIHNKDLIFVTKYSITVQKLPQLNQKYQSRIKLTKMAIKEEEKTRPRQSSLNSWNKIGRNV